MTASINFETFSDADFVRKYSYRTIGGIPIDLGTDVLRFMVRAHPEDATVYIDRSSITQGIIITDAAAGAFTLVIPMALLATLTPGVYVHSLIRTDAAYQSRQDLWRGTLTHSAGPTRWKPGTFV